MILLTEKCGQLGNRLICFAHLIAFCEEHCISLVNPGFHEFSDFFEGCRGRGIPSFIPQPKRTPAILSIIPAETSFHAINLLTRIAKRFRSSLRVVHVLSTEGDTPEFDFNLVSDPRVTYLLGKRPCLLQGWRYRSYELFGKHKDVIRQYFSPVAAVRDQIATALAPLESCDVVVGVHIRHGDYRNYLDGRYFFETAHYASLMHSVKAKLSPRRVGFLVCSNESQARGCFEALECASGPGSPVADMYSLDACDYILAPPSTFSRWASFYGNVPLYTLDREGVEMDIANFQPAIH